MSNSNIYWYNGLFGVLYSLSKCGIGNIQLCGYIEQENLLKTIKFFIRTKVLMYYFIVNSIQYYHFQTMVKVKHIQYYFQVLRY